MGGTIATFRDLSDDLNDGLKDITTSVGQQCRSLDMIHLGNFMMELNEADGWVSVRNTFEAVFY